MIKRLIKWCLNNRFLVILAALLITALGVYSVLHIPVDAIPDIGENQQVIIADWMGRDAKTIEEQVTYPLTSKLFGIPGVKSIRASSAFGFSMVYVTFKDNIDFYTSRTRINEKLQQIQQFLPQGVVPTLGPDATSLSQVFWYTVEGDGYSLDELRSLQDWYIRYQLSSLDGVSEVAPIGGFVKQYQIDVDPYKLATYGIPLMNVLKAIQQANADVGAKVIEQGGVELIVRGVGLIKGIQDIENIVVGSQNGTPVFMRNIGKVGIGPDFRRGALDKEGREAVGGIVLVRYKDNPMAVIQRVKERIKELSIGLPAGVKIVPFYDRTELIQRTTDTLKDTLIEEIILTILVVFFFMMHVRSSLAVSIALPLGVLAAFIIMYALNIEANIMSLSGIAIAIGTLVDMGIIVTENAYRHLHMAQEDVDNKYPRLHVIFVATKEVAPAVMTGVLTIIISFIPVFFLTGQEGKLFTPLAYTKTFALTASMVIALTLTPVLCYYFLKGKLVHAEESFFTKHLIHFYERVLRWILSHRKLFLVFPAVVITMALIIFLNIGREFMPSFDEGSILFMPVVSPAVSLTEAQRIVQIQDRIIKTFPEVESVVGKIGRAETATDPAGIEMTETIINLKPKNQWRKGMTKDRLIQEMDMALKIPGVANIWTQPIINRVDMLSTGIRTPVGVKIYGDDLKKLEDIAEEVKGIVSHVKGAQDLYAEKLTGKPYLEIIPRREDIARYGLNIRDVMDVIEMGIGGEDLSTVYEGRARYGIRVRFMRELRDNPEKLKRILVPTGMGTQIPLGQIADFKITEGPSMINSEDGQLRAYVLMSVRGRDIVGFVEEARALVAKEMAGRLPPGYSIQWSGQFENQVRATRVLSILVPLSLLLSYLLIFMNFKSHRKTLNIFTAIPLSLSGGVLLLALYHYNFSVAVWVGFIALFGISVNDGVLITTYLDQVFRARKPKNRKEITEAVVYAGKARIRPAVMTILTAVLALLPIFIFNRTGMEVMRPMAIPTFGGMIMSTVSIFIVPTLYSIFEERKLNKPIEKTKLD